MEYMTGDYIAKRANSRNWVLAPRLTERLKERGYEVAIHPKTYRKWEQEYIASLPCCPHCGQTLPK